MRPTVSVIMAAQDEADRIGRALDSVSWADEIVVVDGGSVDGTVEVAREFTGKVFRREWAGDGPQKNFALSKTTGDWILVLDADEVVSEELAGSIRRVLGSTPEAVGFEIEFHTRFLGTWLGRRGWRKDRNLRLFKRSAGRITEPVHHARVVVEGPVAVLEGPMLHYSYRDLEHFVEKVNRKTTRLAAVREERWKTGGAIHGTISGLARFAKSFVFHGNFLNGGPGYVYAVMSGLSGFLKHVKTWEEGMDEGSPS